MIRVPRKDNFGEGKIYRLTASGIDECYIGSTRETLKKRLYMHNWAAANPDKTPPTTACKLYEGGRTVTIELVEAYPCTNKQQLDARERHWLELTPSAVNRNTPGGLGWKESRARRQEEHDAYMASYRDIDYDCPCGAKIKRVEKARHERSKKHLAAMEAAQTPPLPPK